MFNIYVVYKCFPKMREEFVKRLNDGGYIEKVRNEDGCIRYDFYFSEKDDGYVLFF